MAQRLALAAAALAAALLASCDRSEPPEAAAPPPLASAAAPAPPTMAKPAAPASLAAIPAPFQGTWNMRLEDCGAHGDDSRLVISDRTLEFYESRGEVRSARMEGDTLHVTAAMSGEGETWEETYAFRLSADGGALLQAVPPDGEGVRRLRCP